MILLVGLASWNFLCATFHAGLQRQLDEADIERDLLIDDQKAQLSRRPASSPRAQQSPLQRHPCAG